MLKTRVLLAGLVAMAGSMGLRAQEPMLPAEYLQSLEAPGFREGHTLPPLTRWGWVLDPDTRIELAENWGYALELGSPSARLVQQAKDPATATGRPDQASFPSGAT